VLNAYRHLRMDHSRATAICSGTSKVLNAYRHLRMDHSCGTRLSRGA